MARYIILAVVAALLLVRLVSLEADFPFGISWDGDTFTDEGLYSCDAITWYLEGRWYLAEDFNQAINVPVLQFIQAMAFNVMGFGLWTLRVVNLGFSFLLVGATYLLVRRFAGEWPALIAVLVFSFNHMFFAFSRKALAEIPVALLITLTMLFASYVRGRWWALFAVLTSLSFVVAMLTKSNAVFAVPIIGAIVLLQDLDHERFSREWTWRRLVPTFIASMNWRGVAMKFVLCSAVFFAGMGVYYFTLVRPHFDEFLYFYSLNLSMTSSLNPARLAEKFTDYTVYAQTLDLVLWFFAFPLTAFLLVYSRRYRTNPLLWICFAWYFLYILLYAYYGRFWPRFFPALLPAVAGWAGLTLTEFFMLPARLRPVAWFAALIFVASAGWNLQKIGGYMTNLDDSYGDMARDIRRIMDEDPESNNILLGHIASSVSLRNGMLPRNDRYGIRPISERIQEYYPRYWITEGAIRGYPLEPYYKHREHVERLYRPEMVARYDPLGGYRGYPIILYRLHPRETPPMEHDHNAMVDDLLAREDGQ